MAKTPSELVLKLGNKIELKSGAKLNFATDTTAPVQEWIPESKMAATKTINLRTAAQTIHNDSVMKLQQFNPSFFLVEEHAIPCRVPGCSATTPRLKPANDSKQIKQDLFLCEIHRTKLANVVSKRCEEEKIFVPSFEHEDFNGYTYLIGELEKAFVHLVKKPGTLIMPKSSVYPNSDLVLAEVFLNARNFLTITQALLNPNGDNLRVVLSACFVLLKIILSDESPLRESQVRAFRENSYTILEYFGINFEWVFLGNPGSQVGGGAGLVVGSLGAFLFALSPVAVFFSAVVGVIAGNLFGRGSYAWYQQYQRDRQNQRGCQQPARQDVSYVPLFQVQANAMGDLALGIHYHG